MSEARKSQVGGDHYKSHKIQPIDVIDEYALSFRLGSAIKYILRDKDTDKRLEDLKKARHYLDWEIELMEMQEPLKHQEETQHPVGPVGPLLPMFSPGWPKFPIYPQCEEIDLTQHPVDTTTPEWHKFRDTAGNDPDEYKFPSTCDEGPTMDENSSTGAVGPLTDGNSSEVLHEAVSANFNFEYHLPDMQEDVDNAVVMKHDGVNWIAGDRGVVIASGCKVTEDIYTHTYVDFGTLGAADVAPVSRDDFYIIGQEVMWKPESQT